MVKNLHHVAILTKNIEDAVAYYQDMLGCEEVKIADVALPGVKMKSAMLPIGDGTTSLQIIEPNEGPGVKELAERGEGALLEVAFQVEDAEAFSDKMKARGVSPCTINEQPIDDKYTVSKFGNRYFILPGDKMRGTRIEVVQVMSS